MSKLTRNTLLFSAALCCAHAFSASAAPPGSRVTPQTGTATQPRPNPQPQTVAFSEGFDDITLLAGNGWLLANHSVPVGSTNWFQGTNVAAGGPFDSFDGAANAYIGANYNNTGNTGTISNWLVTPLLDFGSGASLSFYTRKVAPDSYADRLEVRLSTNGNSSNIGTSATDVGDFTALPLSINPNQTLGVYPTTWTQFTVNLPHNGQGRIAFRYFVTNAGLSGTSSDYIGIDRVVYNAGSPEYLVGGSVSGLAGSGLVLRLNGTYDLPVPSSGNFQFSQYVTNGGNFAVTVATQPTNLSQTCAVTNDTGVISGADVSNVQVVCTTNSFTVSGSVSGLAGSGLVLQLNGANDVPISSDGAFSFPAIADGSMFGVTVSVQPTHLNQDCTVTSGSGVLAGGNVGGVTVTCATKSFAIGGDVSGVTGSGLTLQLNGGNDLSIAADGTFAFASPLLDGSPYAVTILSQPSSALGVCAVVHGSGVLYGSDIASVQVPCDVIYIGGFEEP